MSRKVDGSAFGVGARVTATWVAAGASERVGARREATVLSASEAPVSVELRFDDDPEDDREFLLGRDGRWYAEGWHGEPVAIEPCAHAVATDEATGVLATVMLTGSLPLGFEGREGADGVPALVRRALARGRAWEWREAGAELRRAYALLGASPPEGTDLAAGRAWHRGEHAVQLAAVRS